MVHYPLICLFGIVVLLGGLAVGQEPADLESAQLEPARNSSDRTAPDDSPQHIAFFESKIRPLLIEHCYECHSTSTEASGGLTLDARSGWQTGGDSGPAIVPGDAAASRLYRAISYEDPVLEMPPDGMLPKQVIEDFKLWIDAGAADPREGSGATTAAIQAKQSGLPVDRAHEHWAYRPIQVPALPTSIAAHADAQAAPEASFDNAGDSISPASNTIERNDSIIDRFIDARLHSAGLRSAPQASRAALARRLYFDLTGLPPSVEQLEEFIAADAPTAYHELVEQLLASPRFGETFARHWMDVARYADSITLRGFVLPEAWRYRDYLIESFSSDRPFDQMIREQVAGDLMQQSHSSASSDGRTTAFDHPPSVAGDVEQRRRQLIATAFLALGNTNLEQQDKAQLEMEFIDEQLEVIGRAFLGQTIGCARCHDHKFDPIPTADYYALAGILRSAEAMQHDNVSKWIERPLPLDTQQSEHYTHLTARIAALDKPISELKQQLNIAAKSEQRSIAVSELAGVVVDDASAKPIGQWSHSNNVRPFVGNGYIYASPTEASNTVTFEPEQIAPGEYEVRLAYTAHPNRSSQTLVRVFSADGETDRVLNQKRAPAEDGIWQSLGRFRFEKDGQAYVLLSSSGADGIVTVDAVQFLPAGQPQTAVAAPVKPAAHAATADEGRAAAAPHRDLAGQLQKLEAERKKLQAELDARPRYLTIVEQGPVRDIPIHIRGDVHNLGDVVPRGFLTAVKPVRSKPFDDGTSGRLEFAYWLASAENPLTARVYANRVWAWLMGQGLVASVNNFGTTGREPSHPELLDWLAAELIESGWSTKHLVRTIVLSDAYQRSSLHHDAAAQELDPNNQLYWRGHQRRLSAEALRDAMLFISGELDLTMGGSIIKPGTKDDYDYQHRSTRRSIYHPVFRNSLPELLEAFDFADSSVSVGQRPRSTVATQSLVLMNHPWVIRRAAGAAEQALQELDAGAWKRHTLMSFVERAYLKALAREPADGEVELAVRFLEAAGSNRQAQRQRLEQLIHSLFASLDFRYID
jgi:hypothetical protein